MGSRKLIGRNVRRLRLKQGLSQEELAHRADVGPTYVSKLERGVMNVQIDTLDAVAKALGVRTGDVFEDIPTLKDAPRGLKPGPKPSKR